MASQKQIDKWTREAQKLSQNPEYIDKYIEYRKLAKRADQRLVQLEALSHERHFEGVLEFSYKRAVRDIQSWGGDKRFNTMPPTNITQLEAKISDIEKFLSRPTSKKSSIIEFYKKRADTFNIGNGDKGGFGNEFGVKFTWQDIANYYEDKNNYRNDIKLGSKTEVRVIAVLKRLEVDKVMDDIRKYKEEKMTDINKIGDPKVKAQRLKDLERELKEMRSSRVLRITGSDKVIAKETEKLLDMGYTYEKLMGGN